MTRGSESPPPALDDEAAELARHLADTLPTILPSAVTVRARGAGLGVMALVGEQPRHVDEVDLTGFRRGPDSAVSVLARVAGVGTRVLDMVQDAVSLETHEAWPRIDGRMGTPAATVSDDSVVLGYGVDRVGPPDPSWSLPPFRLS